MTTDITELAQSLKAAAEKATPGEWVYFPKNTSIEYDVGSDESQGSILYVDSGDFTQAQTDRNGEFIALANPANILALVEALEKAQTINAAQDDHINQQQDRIDQLEKGHQEAAKQINSWRRMAKQNIAEREKDIAELDAARQRIAELESRTVTVKLPQAVSAGGQGYQEKVERILTAAGIKWEAE
ncbi:ead/Ea22-like family protein [Klebsiella variicola]